MSKRDDIQWLRALAIIAVVSFHLQPKIFPFGYLGVDIFFVISGYLVTSILSKSPDTVTFYLRRIKRIFPVYFLTITMFFVIGYFKLLPSHFDFIKTEVLWSIFFVNNFPPMLEKKEYFQMISEFKFLLHTWSLSVEIQFYLMAPFLIKFILSKNDSFYWTLSMVFISCLCQTFIPNNAMAFGFVSCRIWQFLIGTLSFLYADQHYDGYVLVEENDLKKEYKKSDAYTSFFIFLTLIFMCFISLNLSPFEADIFRFVVTALTGISIALNNSQSLYASNFINSIFVYIGDASYVVYLLHWPIIIFFKYFHITYGDFFTILCILASTLFIHECFEKPLGKLSWKYNISAVTISLTIIFVLLLTEINKATTFDLVEANEREAESCKTFYYQNSCETSPLIEKYLTSRPPDDGMDRYCSIKLNPSSNKTIYLYAYSTASQRDE